MRALRFRLARRVRRGYRVRRGFMALQALAAIGANRDRQDERVPVASLGLKVSGVTPDCPVRPGLEALNFRLSLKSKS